MHFLITGLLTLISLAASAEPCKGVNRQLTKARAAALAPAIATQLHVPSVDVLRSLKYTGWTIVYVAPAQSEPEYLFYSANPLKTHYVTDWSGAATPNEEEEIYKGILKSAKGIPDRLARCFAWEVTRQEKP